MTIRSGIVLKRYFPLKHKITLFDKEWGKIDCVPLSENICVGALVHYSTNAVQSHGVPFIHSLETIGLPLLLAQEDILFFHHVMELCYHFIPYGVAYDEVFSVLEYLYPEPVICTAQSKKVFLVKLFSTLGIYPEHEKFRTSYFQYLTVTSIDILLNQSIDLEIERHLNEWLRMCISVHPHCATFKTVHFLDESRHA